MKGGGGRRRFSLFIGGLRIGADFFERRRALTAGETARAASGVVDDIADLAHPGIDTSAIHPAVVQFFVDTASLVLDIESRWRFPFSLVWPLARPIARAIGQLVLPRHKAHIVTRVHALDEAVDGRPHPRAIIRTYAGVDDAADAGDAAGTVFQAVAYSTWERDGVRYMSAAFPQPGGHVAGLLRLDPIDGGVVLTSTSRNGDDAGVYLVVLGVALPSPFGERFSLWPAGVFEAPVDAARHPGTTLVGRHEQSFFGLRFVTHDYWFRPAA